MKEENYQKRSKRTSLIQEQQVLQPVVLRLGPCDVTLHRMCRDFFLPDIWKKKTQTVKKPERNPRPRPPTKFPPLPGQTVSGNRGTSISREPPAEPNLLSVIGTAVKMSKTTQQIYVTAGRMTLLEPLTSHRAYQTQSKDTSSAVSGGIHTSAEHPYTQPTPPAGPKPQRVVSKRRRGAVLKPCEKAMLEHEKVKNTELKQDVPAETAETQTEQQKEVQSKEQEIHEHVEDSSQDYDSAREPDIAPSVTEQEAPVVYLRRRRRSRRTIAELCGTLGVNLDFFQTQIPRLRVSISPGLLEVEEDNERD